MNAQGLPMNFLVLGALAVLVLVVVGGAFMSGGTSIFGGIAQFFTTTASTPQDQIISVCESSCSGLDYTLNSESDAVSKPICTKRFNFAVDTNTIKINCFGQAFDQDGTLSATQPISSAWPLKSCSINSKQATILTIDPADCVVS